MWADDLPGAVCTQTLVAMAYLYPVNDAAQERKAWIQRLSVEVEWAGKSVEEAGTGRIDQVLVVP